MTERQRPEIEVEERYAGSPESRATYLGTYKDAMLVLADTTMPADIQQRADELARLYAAARAEKIVKVEEATRALAVRVRTVIPEIVQERGLSTNATEGTLMDAVFSPATSNFQSLQIAEKTGRLIAMHHERQRGGRGGSRTTMIGDLLYLSDVPELRSENEGPYNSPNHPMFTLYISLAEKLGFLEPGESWITSERVKKSGFVKENAHVQAVVHHPTYPYMMEYVAYMTNPRLPDGNWDRSRRVSAHSVTVQSIDPFRAKR